MGAGLVNALRRLPLAALSTEGAKNTGENAPSLKQRVRMLILERQA
jgi:hypothetical protein